MLALC